MITTNSHIKYAAALHKVAVKADCTEMVLRDLELLSKLFTEEKFRAALKKIAWLEKNKLRAVLEGTFKETLHRISLNLVIMLGRARKLSLLPKINEIYSRLYHAAKKIEEIKVCTARKMDSDEEVELIDRLQQSLDRPVSVRFAVNPRLIGGVQVYERGYVSDYSVRNYLETLKKKLMEAE